ncbi:hypothetical protein MMC17_000853 [Xylographa soralifera]|nr:hypothetical protein [Xylographa soralifera]
MVTTPAIYPTHLIPDSQNAIFYKSEKSEHLRGREAVVVTGGVLGGGSSINFMMYTRGQSCDYDGWQTEGWDFKSLLPYFKKLETFHSEDTSIDDSVHGFGGPINVSRGTHGLKEPEEDVLAAATVHGEKIFADMNDFKSNGGFARWYSYIGLDGKRQDAAHRYIHPLMASTEHPNLHLLLQTKVVRVLFDTSKAAHAVEVIPTPSSEPALPLHQSVVKVISARKLVVVSSGALASAPILERSGIGAATLLSNIGIASTVDLPGVGENYQDHNCMMYPYVTSLEPKETLDGLLSGRLDLSQALVDKNPLLGWNGLDVAGKLRPTAAEAKALGPEFYKLWMHDFEHSERPLVMTALISSFLGDHRCLPVSAADKTSQYATWALYNCYPYSRGSVHIVSPDVKDQPRFDNGFLLHPADIKMLLWAYKKQREIYRRTNQYQGELALGHPVFGKDSKAALYDGPIEKDRFKSLEERKAVKDIEYSAEDDAAIEEHIRQVVSTTWHSMGTCKMAPRERGGVVDKDLNVYGVKKLKVADLSICPENVGANTNNTALMIGEKAAAIIAQELGLEL